MKTVILIAFFVSSLPSQSSAQSQDFPVGAANLTATEIRSLLSEKVFSVVLADKTTWRLEYKDNGYFFLDVSTGFRSSGTWTAEDNKLCGQLKGRNNSCNDIRVNEGVLHYRRDSGEIVKLIPR